MTRPETSSRSRLAWFVGSLIIVSVLAAPQAAGAAGGMQIAVQLGAFDIGNESAAEGGVELRFPPGRILGLRPTLGLSGTEDGATWGYGGVRRDLPLGHGWRLTPGFAVALYEDGNGKDLGGPVEFRSSLELSAAIGGHSRLGVAYYHMSNARIYDENPGENSLILTYAFGLGDR